MSFWCHRLDQNCNKNIVRISSLEAFWGFLLASLLMLFLTNSPGSPQEATKNPYNIFVAILVQTMTPNRYFKINWLLKVFKSLDQNSNQKTEFLQIGKVDNFQWRRCLQNFSKNQKFRWLFFKKFDQNSGWKCSCSWLRNSYGILQEFWLEYYWENLGANTSDDFGIL